MKFYRLVTVQHINACGFSAIELLKNSIENKTQTRNAFKRVISASDDAQEIADAFHYLTSLLEVFSVSTSGGYY